MDDSILASSTLAFRLIGLFAAELQGADLELPRSRKARALLAYLVGNDKPVSRAQLGEVFFSSAADPAGSLRWSLSRLNSVLPKGTVVANRSDVRVSTSTFTTDLSKLEALATGSDKNALCDYFRDGYPFEGDFLSDLVFDELPEFETWRLTKQAQYERLKIQATTRFLEASPDSPHVVQVAEKLVALDNHNERSWRYLVDHLAAAGNHREADRVLEMAHRQLAKNNIEPLGLLRKAAGSLSEKPQDTLTMRVSERAEFSRPTIAVLPCVDPLGSLDPAVPQKINAALFAASSSNRSCVTLSFGFGLSLNMNEPSGPDYVIESRLIGEGSDCELSVDFVERASHTCLCSWRERLEQTSAYDIGDYITGYFSKRFELDIQMALVAKALNTPETERSAQDIYYVAASHIYGAEGYDYDKALTLLDTALLIDPGLGCAHAASAWVRSAHPDFNFRAEDRALTASLARQAIQLCQDDSFTLAWSAITIAHIERDLNTAMDVVKRALSFNPYSSFALIAGGLTANLLGDDDASIRYLEQAEMWGEAEPLTFIIYHGRAAVAYQQGDYAGAVDWANKCRGRNPSFVSAIRILGAAQSRLGLTAEARKTVATLHEIDPSETVEFFWKYAAYKNRDTVERICADLKNAGLPEK